MKFSSNMLFMVMLITSTMMVISSESWIGMWVGLEINLMSFIPLITQEKSNKTTEASMMYFLTQSMGSIMFIFFMLNKMNMNYGIMNETNNSMIMISLALKMGAAPLHFWLPETMNKMTWNSCLILMTWQKIAPLFMMSCLKLSMIMMTMSLTSVIIGSVMGLNQTSTRKLMAYSSIAHLGWILSCITNTNVWMMYLMIYSIITFMVVMMFKSTNTFQINQLYINKTPIESLTISSSILSMGGLPPFIGFLAKWTAIQSLIMMKYYSMITMMVIGSLITLLFYIRMITPTLTLFSMNSKWNMKPTYMKTTSISILTVNFMLPLCLYTTLLL
uniref:NADH-ubiquinone oxidoreductase chain 2 n=1 Tax=Embiophila sp. TaxID=2931291 RepID=A0A8T9ZYH7_9HEMI|nr:NADH dehydrogenase subunit 2 [Embiophila sp.]